MTSCGSIQYGKDGGAKTVKMPFAEEDYLDAVDAESTSLSNLNNKISLLNAAQKAVDDQTPIVSTALTNRNNAQEALNIANINLQTT